MIEIDDATLVTILKDEYLKALEMMERFDDKVIVMKGWSITVGSTGIGAALLQDKPALLLLAAGAAFLFWMIEAIWKTFQEAHRKRLSEIEAYFDGGGAEIKPLRIGSAWQDAWDNGLTDRGPGVKWLWGIRMSRVHIYLPHAAIIALSLILWLAGALGSRAGG